MKYITIKIKHILCFIVILFIGFLSFQIFYPDILYGIGKLYDMNENHDIANGYYEKILETDPSSPLAAFTTHRKFLNILSSKNLSLMTDIVYIDHDSSCKSGFNISKEDLKKINEQYEKVIQNCINPNLKLKLQLDTALLNWFGGDYHRSIEILNAKDQAGDPALLNFHKLFLSSIHLLTGDIEKIPTIIDKNNLDSYAPLKDKASFILSYYHLLRGEDYSVPSYEMTQYLSLSNEYEIYARLLNIEDALQNISYQLKRNSTSGDGQIYGTLTLEKQPLPYKILLLKREDDTSFSASFVGEDSISMSITDQNGNFSFINIPKGKYKIAAYVPWPLIKGKNFFTPQGGSIQLEQSTKYETHISFTPKLNIKNVKVSSDHTKLDFDFDPIENASYYVLTMGEVVKENNQENAEYTFYSDPFTQNHISINVNDHRESRSGGMVWDDQGIVPSYVWGPFYTEGKYTYKITAYDQYGIIGDSFGVWSNETYPTIWIPGSPFTKEDHLLFNRSYEKAIKGYKKILETNPNDIHALRVLSVLYSFGYKAEPENKDIKNAIIYTEKLHNLLPHDKRIKEDLQDLRNEFKNNLK
ncbi:tetratricopeptide repeat protein [Inediibacterium massiliense]|uniref:tetratricopeptide repeat protein n=1 Tax=Inediibacterium massiliense TaxID=1658111 RepID=UPI0006B628A5|nr:hypothetical protein [Inediibacterium massiliense]